MRAVISIVLAVTLFTVPITQVAAQVGQQVQAAVSDSTTPPPARIGVPDVEGEKAALLWLAGDSTPVVTDSLAFTPPYRRVSKAGWVAIVVGAALVVLIIVAAAFGCHNPPGHPC
jgi:hypothetical protein